MYSTWQSAYARIWGRLIYVGLAGIATILFVATALAESPPPQKAPSKTATKWQSLFDGEKLGNWKITKFGGEGDVDIKNGAIYLNFGSPLTGITYRSDKKLPTSNYELQLEAQRVDGVDFFCALTFPVGKSHCSLVLGGWGGAVVGISSIDGHDASENETTQYMGFKTGQWYRVRVRVHATRIEAWIDEKRIIAVNTRGKKITTRAEVDLSMPLGIASYDTCGAVRKIAVRPLAGKTGMNSKGSAPHK